MLGMSGIPGSPEDLSRTYSLHCSSFFGIPCRILKIYLANQKKELQLTMETTGKP